MTYFGPNYDVGSVSCWHCVSFYFVCTIFQEGSSQITPISFCDFLYIAKFDQKGEKVVSWHAEVFSFACKHFIFSSVLSGYCPVNVCILVVKTVKCLRYCLRILNNFTKKKKLMCSQGRIDSVMVSMVPWVVSVLTALEGHTVERGQVRLEICVQYFNIMCLC